MGSLSGKRIVVTRPAGQQGPFAELLSCAGGIVLSCPLIRIASCYDAALLRGVLARLAEFDWVCFTSANGVDLALRFAKEENFLESFRVASIACIGPATEKALRNWGLKARMVPDIYQAEGLLEMFKKQDPRGKNFLLLRAKGAREILRETLREQGARVTDVPLYESVLDREGGAKLEAVLREGGADCVTFTSSSTVAAFAAVLKESGIDPIKGKVVLASIGPITSDTLRALGFRVDVEAKVSTTAGLVAALDEFFGNRIPERVV